jgi:hypothetical protein
MRFIHSSISPLQVIGNRHVAVPRAPSGSNRTVNHAFGMQKSENSDRITETYQVRVNLLSPKGHLETED